MLWTFCNVVLSCTLPPPLPGVFFLEDLKKMLQSETLDMPRQHPVQPSNAWGEIECWLSPQISQSLSWGVKYIYKKEASLYIIAIDCLVCWFNSAWTQKWSKATKWLSEPLCVPCPWICSLCFVTCTNIESQIFFFVTIEAAFFYWVLFYLIMTSGTLLSSSVLKCTFFKN